MSSLRIRDSITTVATVWQRAFLDALLAPRRFRKMMSEFRRVSDMLLHPGISSVDAAQFHDAGEPIQMLSLGSDYGGLPSQDLYALLRVVGWVRPRKIFEIGTFHGATTAHLALNCDAEIYTLDLPREIAANLYGYAPRDLALLQPRQEIGRAYHGFNADGRIHQLFGDSRSFDYHPYLGRMDLILIDGCHVYDYVLSDSDKAFQLLSEAGAILWHDFGYSRDVTRVLRDLARRWPVAHVEGTGFGLYTRGVSLHHEFATSAVPAAQGVA